MDQKEQGGKKQVIAHVDFLNHQVLKGKLTEQGQTFTGWLNLKIREEIQREV